MSSPSPFDELVGRAVGSYRIVRLLGKGGMGSVYLGEHPVIGSRVAVKFLHERYAHDAAIVDRFFNEARAVNLIGHDNILQILDLDVTDDGRHYFVMEYLRGRPLQSFVRGGQKVPLQVAGPILLQCCAALQAAHDKGIVHRDLKPDNVYLIARNGRKNFVKLVDFGIAKLTAAGDAAFAQRTQTGMVMGTPAYMSPEQGAGAIDRIDGRSDVYSLGVMMYQMATGKLPFSGSNFGEVLVGHLQRPPPSPRAIDPSVPAAWEAAILRCLAKEPRDRYQSMGELGAALAEVLSSLGIDAELPPADADAATDLDLPAPAPRGVPSSPGPRTPRPGTSPGVRRSSPGPSRARSGSGGQGGASLPAPATELETRLGAGAPRARTRFPPLAAFAVAFALAAAAGVLLYLRTRAEAALPAPSPAPASAAAKHQAGEAAPIQTAALARPAQAQPAQADPKAEAPGAPAAPQPTPGRKPKKRRPPPPKARAAGDGLLDDVFK